MKVKEVKELKKERVKVSKELRVKVIVNSPAYMLLVISHLALPLSPLASSFKIIKDNWPLTADLPHESSYLDHALQCDHKTIKPSLTHDGS